MNSFEIILNIDAMDDSAWVNLQEAEHEVSEASDEAKRDHVNPAKHYIKAS